MYLGLLVGYTLPFTSVEGFGERRSRLGSLVQHLREVRELMIDSRVGKVINQFWIALQVVLHLYVKICLRWITSLLKSTPN